MAVAALSLVVNLYRDGMLEWEFAIDVGDSWSIRTPDYLWARVFLV